MPADNPTEGATLADKLSKLFEIKRMADGTKPSSEDAAEYIRSSGGPTISATYIWQLRKGIKDNPTRRHLQALADFFGVPVGYFFDDGEDSQRIDDQLNLLQRMSESGVYDLALRATELSPESMKAITEMVEKIVAMEAQAREPRDRDGGRASGSVAEET